MTFGAAAAAAPQMAMAENLDLDMGSLDHHWKNRVLYLQMYSIAFMYVYIELNYLNCCFQGDLRLDQIFKPHKPPNIMDPTVVNGS